MLADQTLPCCMQCSPDFKCAVALLMWYSPDCKLRCCRQIGVNESKEYPDNWLRADPLVFVLGFMG